MQQRVPLSEARKSVKMGIGRDIRNTRRRRPVPTVLVSVHLVRLRGAARLPRPVAQSQFVASRSSHAVSAHRPAHSRSVSLLKARPRRRPHASAVVIETAHRYHRGAVCVHRRRGRRQGRVHRGGGGAAERLKAWRRGGAGLVGGRGSRPRAALVAQFLLAAPFGATVRKPDLDAGFGEADLGGQALPGEDVRIVGSFEFWGRKF